MDISSVDELLSTTRAVRKRLDLSRPVEREVILECLRLAVQAPTASNNQDWRWVVVTDADKRAAIAEIYNSVGAEYLAQKANTEKDPQARRVYESATALTSTLNAWQRSPAWSNKRGPLAASAWPSTFARRLTMHASCRPRWSGLAASMG